MKIAILGYGVEGKSTEKYLGRHFPKAEVTILDNFGYDDFGHDEKKIDIDGFDLIVRSPSISPSRLTGASVDSVTSGTKIFFDKCPAPIIGVTGTKGKGTTCSLIASVLKAAGKTVHLVGNIGLPALDELDKIKADDIVVYELSSFQLWDLDKSPQTAVVVHIEPDHLNVHKDFEEYIDAKTNIVRFQQSSDLAIYDGSDAISKAIAEQSKGQNLAYPDKQAAHAKDDWFYYSEQKICSVSELRIPGAYNILNTLAAIDAAWQYTQKPADYVKGFNAFSGLPHRINLVREIDGVKFYDNSIATTPGSAVADIKSFKEPKILILGGADKGSDMTELIAEIKQSNVRQTILIGASADGIEKLFIKNKLENYVNLGLDTTMEEIVGWAYDSAEPGDVVLLSPAHASFDMFEGYSDRGNQFVAAVEALK